jgi:hypothetical protein
MKFRPVSDETKVNYLIWSVKKEIKRENNYLSSLSYDPKPIIDIVKHHIDQWDPMQLLAADSPADEYDGETQTVSIYIMKHLEDMDSQSLSSMINKVFAESFENEFNKNDESIEIASGILSSLRSNHFIK